MNEPAVQSWRRGLFHVSTDRSLLDLPTIQEFLTQSYWAQGISLDVVSRAAQNSLCFGLYRDQQQVGFARVISDYTTFGYLADVFVLESCRGMGLGAFLINCVHSHPDLQGLRRRLLATTDAHGLYAKLGYQPLSHPERLMEILQPESYSSGQR